MKARRDNRGELAMAKPLFCDGSVVLLLYPWRGPQRMLAPWLTVAERPSMRSSGAGGQIAGLRVRDSPLTLGCVSLCGFLRKTTTIAWELAGRQGFELGARRFLNW
jgi:hypothetical protein